MPVYTYRREDGTTFDIKQKFTDEPLTVDAATGQKVVRIVQATSVIFKGSGFYVNDSKGKSSTMTTPKGEKGENGTSASAESTSDSKTDSAPKAEAKPAPVAAPAAD
jgi:predicted nucleic acid-binding Zn ribbon protein